MCDRGPRTLASLPGRLRQRLLGLSTAEVTFTRRGFQPAETHVQQHLEHIGMAFLHGYHAALRDTHADTLARCLHTLDPERRGFAFEGAAMGLQLRDSLWPWGHRRLAAFLAGPGAEHMYMIYVGVGWALALLHRRLTRPLARLDPLLGWLAVDGYGFYHGYFHWQRAITAQVRPRHLIGYACRAFDQGLGRSLWFVHGANVQRIPQTIAMFSPARQADLWSGVGLACAYAEGIEGAGLMALRMAAGAYRPHLAQGVAFAAKTRQRSGTLAFHTALACTIVCDLSPAIVAEVVDETCTGLPDDAMVPAYEVWRQRIQARLA